MVYFCSQTNFTKLVFYFLPQSSQEQKINKPNCKRSLPPLKGASHGTSSGFYLMLCQWPAPTTVESKHFRPNHVVCITKLKVRRNPREEKMMAQKKQSSSVHPATEATQSFAVVMEIAESIVLRKYF